MTISSWEMVREGGVLTAYVTKDLDAWMTNPLLPVYETAQSQWLMDQVGYVVPEPDYVMLKRPSFGQGWPILAGAAMSFGDASVTVVRLTHSEYAALPVKDPNVLYVLEGA